MIVVVVVIAVVVVIEDVVSISNCHIAVVFVHVVYACCRKKTFEVPTSHSLLSLQIEIYFVRDYIAIRCSIVASVTEVLQRFIQEFASDVNYFCHFKITCCDNFSVIG